MRRAWLLTPLVLAGCGGGGTGTPVSGNPLAAAADATARQATERVDLQARLDLSSGPLGQQSYSVGGSGAFDNKAGEGALRLSVTAAIGGSATLDEIFRHRVIWVRSPLISALLPKGKQWLRFDLAKEAQVLGLDFNELTGQTPSDALAKLHLQGRVTTIGKETVAGVATTHYRVALAPRKGGTGAHYKSVEAWVDNQGLVRKVKLDFTTPGTSRGSAHTVVAMVFSHFGAPVSVAPPPAGQVFDNFPKVHK
jgi:hypothetical protein